MTQPLDRLTPAQALAAAGVIAAGQTPEATAAAVTTRAAEGVIAARERAQRWAQRIIGTLWAPVDVYDGEQVAAFTVDAAARMVTAQKTVATAAAAGQQAILSAVGVPVTARPYVPIDVRARNATFNRGRVNLVHRAAKVDYDGEAAAQRVSVEEMSTTEIFNRPARAYRWAKTQGASDEQAQRVAASRLDGLIDGNLMLAQRLAEVQVLDQAANQKRSPIVGMRRVIHPELSRGGTCGLCIAASDRLYTVRELLPIHARCKCTTAAVTKDYDPADDVNRAALGQLYGAAGGTSRAHLKRTRYQIDEHGELGPVLVPERAYKPRTEAGEKAAAAIAPSGDESPAAIADRHLPILEQNLQRLRDSGLGEDSPQVIYHKAQIKKFRAALAA